MLAALPAGCRVGLGTITKKHTAMIDFDARRFMDVARWDLAINRPLYARAAMVIFLVMAVPSLFSVFLHWGPSRGEGNTLEDTAYVAYCTMGNFLVLAPFLLGYMFHNLSTRQGRVNELTLPASRLEKFLWHACLVLFGSFLAGLASFILVDLLHYLGMGLATGFGNSHEFLSAMDSIVQFDEYEYEYYTGHSDLLILLGSPANGVLAMLLWLGFASTFVLGNALRYRHNIVFTLAAHFVLVTVLFILAVVLFVFVRVPGFIADANVSPTLVERLAYALACAVPAVVAVLCWCLSYRLYSRATLTSRLNR